MAETPHGTDAGSRARCRRDAFTFGGGTVPSQGGPPSCSEFPQPAAPSSTPTVRLRRENVPPLSGGTHRPRTTIPSAVRHPPFPQGRAGRLPSLAGSAVDYGPAHAEDRLRRGGTRLLPGRASRAGRVHANPALWRGAAGPPFIGPPWARAACTPPPSRAGPPSAHTPRRVYGNLPCGATPLAARNDGKAVKQASSRAARSPSVFYRVPKMRSPASPRPGMI